MYVYIYKYIYMAQTLSRVSCPARSRATRCSSLAARTSAISVRICRKSPPHYMSTAVTVTS